MVKLKGKFGEVSTESVITTIGIAKKLEKEGKFFVHPFFGGASVGIEEAEPLVIEDTEQNSKNFSENLRIIHHVAFHILSGTEGGIDKKINTEIVDAVRNKYIDEASMKAIF